MTAEIDRRVEELASTQLGHFSVRQVLLLGGTEKVVRHRRASGRWQSAGHGVLRLLGTPITFEGRVMAHVLGSGCEAYASHRCAATLHGLPGFGESVELTATTGSQVQRVDLRRHRTNHLPRHHLTCRNGIPTTTVARTLFDLSAVVAPGRVERAVDTALARRLVGLSDLVVVTRDLSVRGRRKLTVLRRILEARGVDFVAPATELEVRFVELIEESSLPQPNRQVDVGDEIGWIGRVDFLYRAEKVVIEVDGREHHTALLDAEADALRDARLAAAGWTVLRFDWNAVVDAPSRTLEAVRRGSRLRPPATFVRFKPPEGRKSHKGRGGVVDREGAGMDVTPRA